MSDAKKSDPKKSEDKDKSDPERDRLYVNTIELVTAVLIGASLGEVNSIFNPISNVFEYQGSVNAGAIILAYFIVISGWIGYHRSITKRRHRFKKGLIRYVIDFVILSLVFYLISVAEPNTSDQFGMIKPHDQYGVTFLWIVPSLFICYTYWDLIKFYEYRNQKGLEVNPKGIQLTFGFCLVFYVLAIIYYYLNIYYNEIGLQFWETKTSLDGYFIIIYVILIALYRWRKAAPANREIKNH